MTSNLLPTWTAERVELAKALWKDGDSAAQIATQLGGVTRNAVLGKLLREGMLGTRAPKASHKTPRPRSISAHSNRTMNRGGGVGRNIKNRVGKAFAEKRKPPEVVVPLEEPASLGVALFDLLPHQCRWAHGNGPFLFCGHPTHVDPVSGPKPYCTFHCRRSYISSQSRQSAEAA